MSAEILFAYEPVWAIGEKGVPASSDYARELQGRIIEVARTCLGRAAWNIQGYIDMLWLCATALKERTQS